jgi:hypothetical protein
MNKASGRSSAKRRKLIEGKQVEMIGRLLVERAVGMVQTTLLIVGGDDHEDVVSGGFKGQCG